MKKIISIMMAGLLLCSFTACKASEEYTDAGKEETADISGNGTADGSLKGNFKVGIISSLTGKSSAYGKEVSNGVKMAFDEINSAETSFSIAYQEADDESNEEKSVEVYRELKNQEMQAIIGPVTSPNGIEVAADSMMDKIFVMTPTASSEAAADGYDNVFQLIFPDKQQGYAAARCIVKKELAKKVAVMYDDKNLYSLGIYNNFMRKAEDVELDIVSVMTLSDAQKINESTDSDADENVLYDFSAQLDEIRKNGAELVFAPVYAEVLSQIIEQADDIGLDVMWFGSEAAEGLFLLDDFDKSLAENMMLLTAFFDDSDDARVKEFSGNYQNLFGKSPTQFAAYGYDAAYSVYNALEYYAKQNGGLNVSKTSCEEVCSALMKVFSDENFTVSGVSGKDMYWKGTSGAVNREPLWAVVKNGRIEEIKKEK